jgi:hypothetical protein
MKFNEFDQEIKHTIKQNWPPWLAYTACEKTPFVLVQRTP